MITFKDLAIGQCFEFAKTFLGMATGPWIKISARKYKRLYDGLRCRVGSIHVSVCPVILAKPVPAGTYTPAELNADVHRLVPERFPQVPERSYFDRDVLFPGEVPQD